jgi:hypothetical protein
MDMGNISGALERGVATRTHPRLVLLATSLGVLVAQIDTSAVNLALKSIAGSQRRRQRDAVGDRRR